MNLRLVLLALSGLLAACSSSTTPASFERVVVSADKVVQPSAQMLAHFNQPEAAGRDSASVLSDASYILFQREGVWHLTEQSIRMDAGVHYIHEYGVIPEADAQLILAAAAALAQAEKGKDGELYPPGGPAYRPLYHVTAYTHAPLGKGGWEWKEYGNDDARAAAYRQLFTTVRAVARQHGSVLPLTGALQGVE